MHSWSLSLARSVAIATAIMMYTSMFQVARTALTGRASPGPRTLEQACDILTGVLFSQIPF